MADVFISYAHDDIDTARRLAAALEARSWSVFWDDDIRTGSDFADLIQVELKAASCVVVLWSSHSIRSEWVRAEAEDAHKRGILAPVLIERVEPPLPFQIIHTADLIEWKETGPHVGIDKLLDDVANLVGGPALPLEPNDMAPDAIFLSYASPDRVCADSMKEGLEASRLNVWMDVETQRLERGDSWDRKIQSHIERCAVFVPILSRHTHPWPEGYFHKEWKWALACAHGTRACDAFDFIRPVIVDDLPEIPPRFSNFDVVRLLHGVPTAEFVDNIMLAAVMVLGRRHGKFQ